MCLNGWGGTLHEQAKAYLAREAPDVLCLQEVVHTPATSKEWLTYRDGDHVLPQRANFFRDVSEALPEHVAIFCPAAQGILWDGDDTTPSQWGLATFMHRRFPIIGQVQGFVHKGFSPDGYGEHPRSRSAHVVRLHDFDRDWPITIEQAHRLVTLVQAVAEPGDRLVVCGDFNVEPGSRTFAILAGLGVKDLVVGRGHSDTRTSHYKKPGRYADYMLVNEAIEVLAFEVVEQPEVSDHRPLLLDI